MADHLLRKFRGLRGVGAMFVALVMLALIAPAGAEASGPGSGVLSQLSDVVPASAQSAVSAALSQVPSATSGGAAAVSVPAPSAPVVKPSASPSLPSVAPSGAVPVPTIHLPTVQVPTVHVPAVHVPLWGPPSVVVQTPSAPVGTGPRPDVAAAVPALSLKPTRTTPNPRPPAVPDPFRRRHASAHRLDHPQGHRGGHIDARGSARPAAAPLAPSAGASAPWSPVTLSLAPGRRGTQPVPPARHPDFGGPASRARHLSAQGSPPTSAVTNLQLGPPVPVSLAPGGAEGSAPGAAGGAAGATAAILALIGICMLRALSPGLLGLGLTPVRSALLVSRLERPG